MPERFLLLVSDPSIFLAVPVVLAFVALWDCYVPVCGRPACSQPHGSEQPCDSGDGHRVACAHFVQQGGDQPPCNDCGKCTTSTASTVGALKPLPARTNQP
jgi:hypothetical protein